MTGIEWWKNHVGFNVLRHGRIHKHLKKDSSVLFPSSQNHFDDVLRAAFDDPRAVVNCVSPDAFSAQSTVAQLLLFLGDWSNVIQSYRDQEPKWEPDRTPAYSRFCLPRAKCSMSSSSCYGRLRSGCPSRAHRPALSCLPRRRETAVGLSRNGRFCGERLNESRYWVRLSKTISMVPCFAWLIH